jgi:hypothetical protein
MSGPTMETIASNQWRAEIRASIHYLRTIRPLAERIASEHAAWARFIGNASSPHGTMRPREQALGANRFALTFATLRGRLKRATPTGSCATLHESALAWAEALDLLATAVPAALERGSIVELRSIGREAGEAQMRLRIFQRTHAKTVAALKRMFLARPRPPRRPRRVMPVGRARASAPTALPLPPWRRPRPALARRVADL